MAKVILDEKSMWSTLRRLSYEIVEKNVADRDIYLVGIKRRGASLAHIICDNINGFGDVRAHCGEIDISFYRDDLRSIAEQPIVNRAELGFSVEGRTIVLIDDVLYTGRTARAAIDAVLALGRPSAIRLCELVDRGHRELPIRADFVGKNVPTSTDEVINVRTKDYDGEMCVLLERL